MRLDCIKVEDAIWDHARDGVELPADVLSHIERCQRCSQALADAACSIGALRRAAPYPPAPDCREAVINRIAGTRSGLQIWKPTWVTGSFAAAAATIILWHMAGNVAPAYRPDTAQMKAPQHTQKMPDVPLPVKTPTVHSQQNVVQPQHIQAKTHQSGTHINVLQRQTSEGRIVKMASAARTAIGIGITAGRPVFGIGEAAQQRVQAGYDVHKITKTAAMYGRFAYNKMIPVLISAGAEDTQDVVKLYWVIFRRERSIVHANLRAMVTSWPKGKWKINLSLLDKANKPISSAESTVENQGIIIGIPCLSEGDFHFYIGPIPPHSSIKRFSVTISEDPEDAKVDKELTQTDQFPSQEKGDRAIDVDILNSDGEPVDAQWTLWRGCEGAVPEEPITVFHSRPVYWKSHGLTWVPVRHVQASTKLDDLAPGLYRVSATTIPPRHGGDSSPIGTSDLINLRDISEASVNVRLQGGYPLTIKVVDAKSGKPIPHENILLRQSDGLPLSDGSSGFGMSVEEDGTIQFSSLLPGTYTLEIGPRDWWYALHPEAVKVVTLEVLADRDNTVTIPYTPSRWEELMIRAE